MIQIITPQVNSEKLKKHFGDEDDFHMINFERYGKWFFIAMGLLLLVGITGWLSGGKNGNLIFSSAITIVMIIFGIGFLLVKLPELRHGREKAYQMRQEEFEKEYNKIKKESDLWDALTREQRKNLCERLGIPSRYSKSSLIGISTRDRKVLIYLLNVEFAQKDEKSKWNFKSGRPTHYEILGIEKNATEDQIKDAYRRKSLAWHPDKKKDIPDADEYMKIVNEANDVLSDREKRRQYDSVL